MDFRASDLFQKSLLENLNHLLSNDNFPDKKRLFQHPKKGQIQSTIVLKPLSYANHHFFETNQNVPFHWVFCKQQKDVSLEAIPLFFLSSSLRQNHIS